MPAILRSTVFLFKQVRARSRNFLTPHRKASDSNPMSAMKTSVQGAQIILAPARPSQVTRVSIFLAGTTTRTQGRDWRELLTEALAHLPITIFNPHRPDRDSSWREDTEVPPFREQVEWELDTQERADLIILYFGPNTDAPVSLLELGLCARSKKALVVCHREYRKRGNVHLVAQRFGIEFMDTDDDFVTHITGRLQELGVRR